MGWRGAQTARGMRSEGARETRERATGMQEGAAARATILDLKSEI